ncbi:efflux RND transporter permease subunit [Inquilinus sp. CAU 1745]|uniref:efflux RND transporter permease subunit n=1 Tax=Inquilinus sp. CAU 1745 TaxID=3140369 RepID=UPI00325C0FA5
MNAIIDAALNRSRMVLTALVLLLLGGLYAYIAIPKESNPDVNIPIIYVSMTLDGVSPEDAERLLVRPMEQELRSIEGVKEMTATAYEGGGNVILEFDAGFDIDLALLDVREAVDLAKPDLPEEADEPTVNEVNLSLFPVLVVTLSGDVPERTLVDLANNLQDRIETIPSVLEADIAGDREEMVEIIIDPLLVESYGLSGDDVATVVNRSNRLVAAGNLDTGDGRFSIKVPGLIENLDDLLNMPVKTSGDAVVRFRDIAEVRRTYKDPEGFARVNGQRAVALEISKRTGENIIETIEAVRAVVEEERARWPDSVQVAYTQDQSDDIRTMLSDLQNNMVSAILLVMFIIVGTLGLRTAGLVGVAIPGSFLVSMLVLMGMGLTVNIVVLFALILAIGQVIDGAIVVTEFADRKMADGLTPRDAYATAAKRMAWPIIAGTCTTLAAFFPLLFWPGVVGEFMKYMPITLFATLLSSLLMALIFIPALGAHVGRPQPAGDGLHALARGEHEDLTKLTGLTGAYVRTLSWALKRPATVILATTGILFGIWFYYVNNNNGVEFFPDVEPQQAIVLVHARGNLSIEQKDMLMREVETRVLELSDEFTAVYTRTGSAGEGSDVAEDVIGQISIELVDWEERRSADIILDDIRNRTSDLAGIRVETREPDQGPPVGKPIQVELTARNPSLLPQAVEDLRTYMEGLEGLIALEDDRPLPGVQWELSVNRAEAAKYGLDVMAVGQSVKLVTNGLVLGTYRPDDSDDEIDITLRYPEEWRSIEQLNHIRIVTPEGAVPISNFVTYTPQPMVGTLNRTNAQRVMTVGADVLPGHNVDAKVQEIRAWIDEGNLDPAVRATFGGEDEEQRAAEAFLSKAFMGALFIMAVILLTQFNSFYNTLLILSAVVMSTIGVIVGLIVTGQPFGIVMTGIGIIALAGTIVNNNIILIDTYDQLKESEPTAFEALLKTGAQRMRPVLLTALTGALGLIPMMLSVNIDFIARDVTVGAPSTQWWIQLSTAMVFGLSFATGLTLLVTPSALMIRANLRARKLRRRERKRAARMAASGPAPAEGGAD